MLKGDDRTPSPVPVSAVPSGKLRQPITGLAEARAAGVNHDHLAASMTHAVRRFHGGVVPAWWTLAATQSAEAGRRWPLETILVEDWLQAPLGDMARGFISVVGQDMPWEQLSIVLSAPGIFTYLGSPGFTKIEAVGGGFNVVLDSASPPAPSSASNNRFQFWPRSSTFVGARFDPAMSLDERIDKALDQVEQHLRSKGLSVSAGRWRGRRPVGPRSWVNICGYRYGDNLIELEVTGLWRDWGDAYRHEVRVAVYELMHAYNAPSVNAPDALDYAVEVHI